MGNNHTARSGHHTARCLLRDITGALEDRGDTRWSQLTAVEGLLPGGTARGGAPAAVCANAYNATNSAAITREPALPEMKYLTQDPTTREAQVSCQARPGVAGMHVKDEAMGTTQPQGRSERARGKGTAQGGARARKSSPCPRSAFFL